MKKTAKLTSLFVVLVLAIYASVSMTFAWLYPVRDSMVLVAGDIRIDVTSARYAFARTTLSDTEEILTDDDGESFYDLKKSELNAIPVASGEKYVIYEFVVRNLSQTRAQLSFRLSDFSKYLYKDIVSYTGGDIPSTIPFKNYTAKNILQIKYMKYSYGDAVANPDDAEWMELEMRAAASIQLWKYSYGKYILGNEDAAFDYIKLSKCTELGDCVTIRFAVDGNINQESVGAYYDWLTGKGEYIWNCCQSMLGDAANDELIEEYLEGIKLGEQNALSEAAKSTITDGFQLTINYFEFVGENIPFEDSVTKDPNE